MLRLLASTCLAFALAVTGVTAQTAAPAAPTPATEADVAALLGDWTISGESQMGPFSVLLSMKVAEGKPVATMSSEVQAPTEITDITKTGESVLLNYAFDYQGQSIPAVLWLTPKNDALDAYFSFADGAFEMGGVGEKTAAAAE